MGVLDTRSGRQPVRTGDSRAAAVLWSDVLLVNRTMGVDEENVRGAGSPDRSDDELPARQVRSTAVAGGSFRGIAYTLDNPGCSLSLASEPRTSPGGVRRTFYLSEARDAPEAAEDRDQVLGDRDREIGHAERAHQPGPHGVAGKAPDHTDASVAAAAMHEPVSARAGRALRGRPAWCGWASSADLLATISATASKTKIVAAISELMSAADRRGAASRPLRPMPSVSSEETGLGHWLRSLPAVARGQRPRS